MSDEITLEGKEYFSSKRASELSGYAQDYIGQLARSGAIEARRIGGLWYVLMDSLHSYKAKAESFVPEPPKKTEPSEPDTIISFEGKDFISAARAAKITSYSQDYVGQLARSGKVLSRQVGNRWYVDREAIMGHKQQKDALLAAVQTESVGLKKNDPRVLELQNLSYASAGPFLTYTKEEKDLIPALRERSDPAATPDSGTFERVYQVPIRVSHRGSSAKQRDVSRSKIREERAGSSIHGKTMFYGTLAAAALTIVIVLSFGFPSLKSGSVYTVNIPAIVNNPTAKSLTASAEEAFVRVSDILEQLLVPELIYKRGD